MNKMKKAGLSVLCLISINSNAMEIDMATGIVTDQAGGLEWKACAEGMFWDNGSCLGEANLYTMKHIKDFYQNQINKIDHWRVPYSFELESLVICKDEDSLQTSIRNEYTGCEQNIIRPTISQDFFPNTKPVRFWTLTESSPDYFENVSFYSGAKYSNDQKNSYALRLVVSA